MKETAIEILKGILKEILKEILIDILKETLIEIAIVIVDVFRRVQHIAVILVV
jgi:hypothetical protein